MRGAALRPMRAWLALFAFVGGTLVLPAAHIYNHWDDHFHTPQGVVYVDGRAAQTQRSLAEVLQSINRAAFGATEPGAHADGDAHGHREPGQAPALPQPIDSDNDLHFGTVLVAAAAFVPCWGVWQLVAPCREAMVRVNRTCVAYDSPWARGPPVRPPLEKLV